MINIARYSITRATTSWLLLLILLVGGWVALDHIGRLEDPEFTLKQAMVITRYAGANAEQVEQEVTYRVENAIQQLPYVDHVTSVSSPGLSQVKVEMKSTLRGHQMPQVWDELRRKINDMQGDLPPGAGPSMVRDDFADVYGVLLALTGPGYSYQELADYADYLRRELVLLPGIGKVSLSGKQQEIVVVEIARSRLANFGIAPQQVINLLQTQNAVTDAGRVLLDGERLRIETSGAITSVAALADLLISNPGAQERILLSDVATVRRDYAELPQQVLRYNGQPSLWLGISFAPDVNVVAVGAQLQAKLEALAPSRPLGMQTALIYDQPSEVDRSVTQFLINLAEAVSIVVLALLLTMGMRSGVLIGAVLLITVMGSFIFMYLMDIQLQRVSLGALIIALGMLVDNAIVVAEGMLVGVRRGLSRIQAASQVVQQNLWPLLGATAIAVIAFAPIGLSSDASGEYANSLFWVMLISLLLSWFTAITLTPFLGNLLYRRDARARRASEVASSDGVYDHWVFQAYRQALSYFLAFRKLTLLALLALLAVAAVGFTQVKQNFFPPATLPMAMVDLWYPQSTDIRATIAHTQALEQWLLEGPQAAQIEFVASTIGQGAPRFTLTYLMERSYESYAQLLIRSPDVAQLQAALSALSQHLQQQLPDVEYKMKPIEMGPPTAAKIEVRFSGPDPDVLRQLATQAQQILRAEPGLAHRRDDWRQRAKVLQPQFNEAAARRLGITKADVDAVLLRNFNGQPVGLYRDGTDLLPIVVRAPANERNSIEDWQELQVYSNALAQYVPLAQVVSDLRLGFEDHLVVRRDRKRTLSVMADLPIDSQETPAQVFQRVQPALAAIALPRGYSLEFGGEFEASKKATKAVFEALPLAFLVMFIITVLLFSSIRQAAILWTTVPLSLIGVTLGLLLTQQPFGFMALLGFLSLSGMLIKNGVVLLEQVRVELAAGKAPYQALLDASVSRVRPVMMAAVTTIVGMIPLLFDGFFASMAVVIMFGLGFATLLTLVVVPVMYATVMRVKQEVPRSS